MVSGGGDGGDGGCGVALLWKIQCTHKQGYQDEEAVVVEVVVEVEVPGCFIKIYCIFTHTLWCQEEEEEVGGDGGVLLQENW